MNSEAQQGNGLQPLFGLDKWWQLVGWMMILVVIGLSLLPAPQLPTITAYDKVNHLLAYGSLMFWWGMLRPRRRIIWAGALMLMGLVLEVAQSVLPERYMEWQDAAANGLGIALALLLLYSRAALLLRLVDRFICGQAGNGGDARLP